MSASAEKVIARVTFEIGEIERLLATYADLLTRVREGQPDLVEATAVSTVLHSFYMGLENVFQRIAKDLDGSAPSGAEWHGRLLTQMTQETAQRGSIISPELYQQLRAYLAFRHLHRHAYPFRLEWDRMAKLVGDLDRIWTRAKAELETFLDSLRPPENDERRS